VSERPAPSPATLSRRLLRVALALAVLCAVAAYLVVRFGPADRRPAAARCTVVPGSSGHGSDPAEVDIEPAQAANAAAIAAVGTARGMPERAVTIALATAMQESALHNLDHGDRDSLGLFQQRPSQGWGTAQQIMDPAYAAGAFYERLAKVHGYATMPLTEAAQQVQHSGYPQAYAKHEPDATLLAAALTGRTPAALSCTRGPHMHAGDPAAVRRALVHDFGSKVLAQPAAAGHAKDGKAATASGAAVRTGAGGGTAAVPAAAPGADRTVSVPVQAQGGDSGAADRRGWTLAHWAVAHSEALGIERVRYAGREWTASGDGAWHTARKAAGDGKNGSGGAAQTPDTVQIVTAR
jgi:hypothetical protein